MRRNQEIELPARKLPNYAQSRRFQELAGKKIKARRKVLSLRTETVRKWCIFLASAILLVGFYFVLF